MASASTRSTSKRRAAPLPPDERRTAIIDAVLPLLIEHGNVTTTRQMAEAAHVSEGTIFNVFVDKDELIAAVLDRAFDHEPFELSIAAIDAALPFETQLVRATELIQTRTLGIWQLISQFGNRHTEHRPMPTSEALVVLLSAQPERLSMSADDAAGVLRSLALALSHPMLTTRRSTPEHIVDIFLNGVGT